MIDKLSKYISWVLYGLLAVSVVLAILFYSNNLGESSLMRWAYILLVTTLVIMIVSPIFGFIQQPTNVFKLLVMLGVVAVFALVAYSLAGNTFSDARLAALDVTAETSKLVGMGLLFTYFAGSIAILAIIYSGLSKFFK
jgi:hypothetical protein